MARVRVLVKRDGIVGKQQNAELLILPSHIRVKAAKTNHREVKREAECINDCLLSVLFSK